MLKLEGSWVWDFWFADDGEAFHIFYLHAPTSLGDEERRHRAARIGHAISDDLVSWTPVADLVLTPGETGAFDETATWTGSVVRGDDGLWRMFYTGSRFLDAEPSVANIESVGVAVSEDLVTWTKAASAVSVADARWYETWGTSEWKEEAWRDPWVFKDAESGGWHMLVTARANHGALDDRGVIGHAFSTDLETWEARPPLSAPGAGFAHLEVPQVARVDGQWVLLFSSTADSMTAALAADYPGAGTWAAPIVDPTLPYDLSSARPITTDALYSGRLVQRRGGTWAFLAFENVRTDGVFTSSISDPFEVTVVDGRPTPATRAAVR